MPRSPGRGWSCAWTRGAAAAAPGAPPQARTWRWCWACCARTSTWAEPEWSALGTAGAPWALDACVVELGATREGQACRVHVCELLSLSLSTVLLCRCEPSEMSFSWDLPVSQANLWRFQVCRQRPEGRGPGCTIRPALPALRQRQIGRPPAACAAGHAARGVRAAGHCAQRNLQWRAQG